MPSLSAGAEMRTSWQVTKAVWRAMFVREAMVRTTGDRMAWFWMIFEPMAIVMVMVGVRAFARSRMDVNGVEQVPWLMVGMLGFFQFRETMLRAMGAVNANRGLFVFRQVKPVDPVLVRSFVEGALKTFIFLVFIAGAALLGIDLIPDEPILAMALWLAIWLMGTGAGLMVSVGATLIPEIGRVVRILSFPLLLLSGALFPLSALPYEIRSWLMMNPIAHGLELLRAGFFDEYRLLPETDLSFFLYSVIVGLGLGLMLHIRYAKALLAR